MYYEFRHKVELLIFLTIAFIAFCTPTYWIQFAFLAFVAFMILLVDMMFLNDDDFIYDPDYSHWKDISEPKDFQFESDYVSMKEKKKVL